MLSPCLHSIINGSPAKVPGCIQQPLPHQHSTACPSPTERCGINEEISWPAVATVIDNIHWLGCNSDAVWTGAGSPADSQQTPGARSWVRSQVDRGKASLHLKFGGGGAATLTPGWARNKIDDSESHLATFHVWGNMHAISKSTVNGSGGSGRRALPACAKLGACGKPQAKDAAPDHSEGCLRPHGRQKSLLCL